MRWRDVPVGFMDWLLTSGKYKDERVMSVLDRAIKKM